MPKPIVGLCAAIMFYSAVRAACDAGYHLESGVRVANPKARLENRADATGGYII